MKWIQRGLLHHSQIFFIVSLLFGLLLSSGVFKIEKDFSTRIWFRATDPYLKVFDDFQREFGNDGNFIVALKAEGGLFQPEVLQDIQDLTFLLERTTDVIRVDSLTNFQWVHGQGDDIIIEPLIPDLKEKPISAKELSQRRNIALSNPKLKSFLVNEEGNTTAIFARLKPSIEENLDFNLIYEEIKALIKPYEKKYDIHITGTGSIPAALQETTFHDIQFLVPTISILVVLLLWITFRNVIGVVLPVIIILITNGSAFGIAGWLGIKFDSMVGAVPEVLIAICIADSIHVLMSYYLFLKETGQKEQALDLALKKNFIPTLLTSVSTAIGFFSVSFSDIVPVRNLAILAGIGTLLAWVFSLTIIFYGLRRFDSGKPKPMRTVHIPFPVDAYLNFLTRHGKKIIIMGIFCTGTALYLALQNEVNANLMKYFKSDVPARVANDFIIENIGGGRGVEVVVDSGKPEGIKNPEFLQKVEKLSDWLMKEPYVSKVLSINDILKDINQALHSNEADQYRIPESQEMVAQQLFLYTLGIPQGMDLNYWKSMNDQRLRINVLWTIEKTNTIIEKIELIDKKIPEFDLKGEVTGKAKLVTGLNSHIVTTFLNSMSIAIFLICLLMIFVFKSLNIGLLSMIPNVTPAIFGGMVMTLLDKPIDTGTVLVMSVCLGIAVDDTIHMLSDYHRNRMAKHSVYDSLKIVFNHTGKALIFTTLILVIGFGSFVFGEFVPTINFGMMTAIILLFALIADLVILPAILLVGGQGRKNSLSQ